MSCDRVRDRVRLFLSCLQFSIRNTVYEDIIFKPKQVICLESVFLNRDTLAILPTGYGKSATFHLLPKLIQQRNVCENLICDQPIVVVVSPLNSLMDDQLSVLHASGISAAILKANRIQREPVALDSDQRLQHDDNMSVVELQIDADMKSLERGEYSLVFCHPEAVISSSEGSQLMQSVHYFQNVQAVVVDEAHCILEWGEQFRPDYSRLGMVSAFFPNVPLYALTATATNEDREMIIRTLCMKDVKKVIGNIDRHNIFIEKKFKEGNDDDALEQILLPIMEDLTKQKLRYPLTIIYLPLQWCGYAYNFFDYHMGKHQYFPYGANPEPSKRLFAQYHSPQTQKMKDEILKQLCSSDCTVRVIFATVAIGMGVNIPNVRHIIHFGVPGSVRQYFQEIGRAGRDNKPSTAVLYYNNKDISSNRKSIGDDIRVYCRLNDGCLRKYILTTMDAHKQDIVSVLPGHMCCSYCKKKCTCLSCIFENLEY